MSIRVSLALGSILAAGCGQYDLAPPDPAQTNAPEVLYLVHQEVMAVRLDGTYTRSLGRVGDDKHRTGSPRWLPDGRVAVLADDTGGIFPYVGPHQGFEWTQLTPDNVTINDSLCGVSVDGQPRVIYTTTPFLPTRTTLQRANPDDQRVDQVGQVRNGVFANPAPYDDGRVLAVRMVAGVTTIEILDVSGPANRTGASETVGLPVVSPLFAMSPARLPDGRVVFIRVDSRDIYDQPIGEIWEIPLSGDPRPTGLTDVAALVVVDDKVIYELVSDATGHTELMISDLSGKMSSNLTNTPFVDEHLGWSN
ncbi:MAG TPA: hypothetical protein VFF06_35580 [Polyangia bacterium]|nr:hypothetical protein [Polyangia bacterium]